VFFTSKLTLAGDVMPNRMAPNTATVFLFIALALWSLDLSPKGWSPTHAFAIIAGFGALLPLTGYLYGVASFDGIASFIPMAVHTALTFLLLATGLFFTQTAAASHTEVFIANDSRGVLARRLFPSAVLVMLGIGWVRLWGERHGFYDNAFGTALFALLSSVVLVVLVRWTITTVGRVEAEREVAKAKLQNLNRRKDEMIAVVSHDLCSPLTGFRMVIDLMRENPERPSEELLNLMDHSAKRMVSMVRGLLDISKLQADETTLEFEQGVRVSDIIREALEPLEINASAKQITLDIEVAPEEPAICADPLRVSQIFSNLLSNAVKFTGHGGTVSVALHPDGDGVRVKVHDTGLGISEPELPHIFDKFRQTTTKATDGETGAGLGLAIVRELVLLHKGRIDVTSQVNRGTTFTVFLPGNPGLTDKQPRPIGAA
jgi:signal transduction histidine kinase